MAKPLTTRPSHHKFIDDFSQVLLADLTNYNPNNIETHDPTYFRWFDTGDLQDIEMLWSINEIAFVTPEIKHWLPTKEASLILQALRDEDWMWCSNLTIRLSVHLRNEEPSEFWRFQQTKAKTQGLNLSFSQVFDPEKGPSTDWFECPALKQDHKCLTCRHCWSEEDVAYPWRKK